MDFDDAMKANTAEVIKLCKTISTLKSELTALKAERDRYRDALEEISEYDPTTDPDIEDTVDCTFKLMGIALNAIKEAK